MMEATQRLQREMWATEGGRGVGGSGLDPLFLTLQQGRSLKAALLIKARAKANL
jgi:hypothetical protein